ncbi:MAG: DUF1961 family protein [Opitutales bacterium]|nr:DUF1961 family protein [Opitutales bacterium]
MIKHSSLFKKLTFLVTSSALALATASADKMEFEIGKTLYKNALSSLEDIEGWVIESSVEGQPVITFPNGRMRMESEVHYLLWCPVDFPDNIRITWEFQPRRDDGLAMFWLAAKGRDGEDLFDDSLAERTGAYPQYFDGDINALHVAYFRRNAHGEPLEERFFQTSHLRKSHGFHLVADAGDPIPSVRDVVGPYQMEIIKYGPYFRFSINGLKILEWEDSGDIGPILEGGKIGLRQMAGLIADYGNLKVQAIERK